MRTLADRFGTATWPPSELLCIILPRNRDLEQFATSLRYGDYNEGILRFSEMDFGVQVEGDDTLQISCEPFDSPCEGDLDGDNKVNGSDLGLMLAQWGSDGSADLNDDGVVDGADLGLILAAWGDC